MARMSSPSRVSPCLSLRVTNMKQNIIVRVRRPLEEHIVKNAVMHRGSGLVRMDRRGKEGEEFRHCKAGRPSNALPSHCASGQERSWGQGRRAIN